MEKRNSKRILWVQYNFCPIKGSESFVSAKVAKYLADQGYILDIVHGNPKNSLEGTDHSLDGYLSHKNINRIIVSAPESKYIYGIINRIYPDLLLLPDHRPIWIWAAIRSCKRLLEQNNYDYIYTRSQFLCNQMVGLALSKFSDIPWVTHFSDPWVDNPYVKFKSNWVKKRNGNWEREVMEKASIITFASPYTCKLTQSKYPDHQDKMRVLLHSFDPALYKTQNKEGGHKIKIGHIGSLYGARNPKVLFQALSSIYQDKPELFKKISFEFIGPMDQATRNLVENFEHRDLVKITKPVDYLSSLRLLGEMDVLLVIDAPAKENQFLPSKLIDYLGANKKIIGLTPIKGATADLLRSIDCPVIDPNDVAGIKKALVSILNESVRSLPQATIRKYEIDQVNQIMPQLFS